MRAAVVRSFDRPLEIEDLPDPGARHGSGARPHRDLRALPHRHPRRPRRVAGQAVAAVHPGPRGRGRDRAPRRRSDSYGLEPGMRVALPWLGYACGVCRYCNSGRETLCLEQQNMGYALNGGFAEYALGYARHVVRVPDGIDSADASPLTCAGVTTYKAVKDSGATSSSLVAVFGAGGLGHLAVQYARITGATVVAVDINDARLASAGAVGAELPDQPASRGPDRGHPAPRRRRRGDLDRGQAAGVRAGVRLARPRRQAGVRRPPGRQPHPAADLRDRPRRARHPRVDRRHPPRPRGGLRAPPPRSHAAGVRGAQPRRGQRPRSSRCSTAARPPRGSCCA